MGIDENKLKQLRQPMDTVLNYDLEKLRHESDIKRGILWNQIKSNETLFEREFMASLPVEERKQTTIDFALAKLLLTAAARSNGERTPIISNFNAKELDLISSFERFSVFDILSIDEIADRMSRREEIYNLAMGFFQNEYTKLDEMLEAPEIQKDLKVAFNQRYRARLNKVGEGVQAYIRKYGVGPFIEQVEDKVKGSPDNMPETTEKANVESPEAIVTKPIPKAKKKIHLKPEWVAIILACVSLFGYLIGFQLWPWIQSLNSEQSYVLIVKVIPSDLGTIQVSPLPDDDGKYEAGSRVTLEARANSGARFVRWSGDANGTLTVFVLTMNGDKQAIAEFEDTSNVPIIK